MLRRPARYRSEESSSASRGLRPILGCKTAAHGWGREPQACSRAQHKAPRIPNLACASVRIASRIREFGCPSSARPVCRADTTQDPHSCPQGSATVHPKRPPQGLPACWQRKHGRRNRGADTRGAAPHPRRALTCPPGRGPQRPPSSAPWPAPASSSGPCAASAPRGRTSGRTGKRIPCGRSHG